MVPKYILYSFLLPVIFSLFSCHKESKLKTPDYNWYKDGNRPASYEIGVDEKVLYHDEPTNYLKYTSGEADGFGTIMKDIKPGEFLGKRVKLTGFIKSENIENSAGMWMRVDGNITGQTLGFDNMQNRPIRGTNDWTRYEIVLDVPQNAARIFYGVLIAGKGEVWFNEILFDTVNTSIPSTNMLTAESNDTATERSELPAKLQYIPNGIEVKHTPDSVYAGRDAKDTNNYYWFHRTSVKALSEDLEITEFGTYMWFRNHWIASTVTDKPFSNKDFADWYSCPEGKLIKGKTYEDKSNWYRSPQLKDIKVLWYYIGKNEKGEKFKGTAVIEYLPKLKKRKGETNK
jgi:hypothetical protein